MTSNTRKRIRVIEESSDDGSDAGASPSVSDSETTSSSRSTSPSLKIVCDPIVTTPKKKCGTTVVVPTRPIRKKNVASNNAKPTPLATSTPAKKLPVKKKKRRVDHPKLAEEDESAKGRNKRRMTKKERNTRAGKIVNKKVARIVPVVEEDAVALDAEIDRVLEEKAVKNNLTATNVKNIIRTVITNKMVRKMIVSTVRKKTDKDGEQSSDDETIFEPKLTRAKTKELMEKQSPLWSSPVKVIKKQTETQMLITHDLPEGDSSGDEEYVPRDNELHHSDDENSSFASHHSDIGSPLVSTPMGKKKRFLHDFSDLSPGKDNMFKTPPPRLKSEKNAASAIGQRTRSKLPLNDTPLEDLEMQLIPPDITTDMYDWGESDNEDYLAFLKAFLCPGQTSNENNDDEEADPEYNVMEEEEDDHDREEHRMDRAVKVSKKELNELVAELFEDCHLSSGGEIDDFQFSQHVNGVAESSNRTANASFTSAGVSYMSESSLNEGHVLAEKSKGNSTGDSSVVVQTQKIPVEQEQGEGKKNESVQLVSKDKRKLEESANVEKSQPPTSLPLASLLPPSPTPESEEPLFTIDSLQLLRHQMRQHIQLVAQSYVLTASWEDPHLKNIAKTSKSLIVELRNFSRVNGENSVFTVCNLEPASHLVNTWPPDSAVKSPIKKKILEEKYLNDFGPLETGRECKANGFPRNVVKLIGENRAFIYPKLLPDQYFQKSSATVHFSESEDSLLAIGLDQLKSNKLSIACKSELISDVLMPGRSPKNVYHRIRNIRKTRSSPTVGSFIQTYFITGILPCSSSRNIEWDESNSIPISHQPRGKLPRHWQELFDRLMCPSDRWSSTSTEVTRSIGGKLLSQKSNSKAKIVIRPLVATVKPVLKEKSISNEENVLIKTMIPDIIRCCPIPEGSDLQAIPLLNSRGDPGAYMLVPKYALKPPGNSNSPQESSHSYTELESEPNPIYNSEVPEKAAYLELESASEVKVTTVGVPFSIPGLKNVEAGQLIDISSLDSPLKKEILEKAGTNCNSALPQLSETDQCARTRVYERDSNNKDYIKDESVSSDGESSSSSGFCRFEGDEEVHLDTDETSSVVSEPIGGCELITLLSDSDDDAGTSTLLSMTLNLNKTLQDPNDATDQQTDENTNKNQRGRTQERETGSSSGTTTNTDLSSMEFGSAGSGEGGGGDDGDENNGKKHPRVSLEVTFEEDIKDEETDEDINESELLVSKSKTNDSNDSPIRVGMKTQATENSSRVPKKIKRSPGGQSKKRASKYNVTAVDKLYTDNDEVGHSLDEVSDAFVDTFLGRVQSTVETCLYQSFLQLLCDFEETRPQGTQVQLYAKVQVLLKDYPELVKEFASMLQDEDAVECNHFMDAQETQAQVHFMHLLEKWTADCPQLKTRILHKLKTLKEEPTITEKEVIDLMERFFQGNPVMMQAFQAMFRSVFRPQSTASAVDFEEIDLEMEENGDNSDDIHIELVKLPEETAVPSSGTCSCVCHADTTNLSYISRAKHCNKCSVKDGKIFIHNGRVMRPVNVAFTTAASARKIVSGNACANCLHSPSKSITTVSAKESPPLKLKEEADQKETIGTTELHNVSGGSISSAGEDEDRIVQESLKNSTTLKDEEEVDGLEDGEIVDDEEDVVDADEECESQKDDKKIKDGMSSQYPQTSGSTKSSTLILKNAKDSLEPVSTTVTGTQKLEVSETVTQPWTIDEDRLILRTCQVEPTVQIAFFKLDQLIPHRTLEEIQIRCMELVSLLQQAARAKSLPSKDSGKST